MGFAALLVLELLLKHHILPVGDSATLKCGEMGRGYICTWPTSKG